MSPQDRPKGECRSAQHEGASLSRFDLIDTPLQGLKLVQRQRLGDSRGFLSRLFCAEELALAGWHGPIAQLNHTYTARQGTVRGLHFQHAPHAEAKLVSCLRGQVWDVAVDLRQDSPTFGRWFAQRLSADNGCALLIPAGFAHGFQTECDDVELLYCHSAAHAPQAEGGLHPQDPQLAITWPLPISEMSARDASHPAFHRASPGVLPAGPRAAPAAMVNMSLTNAPKAPQGATA